MSKSIKKMKKEEKTRLLKELSKTTPGTKEYRELQAQLGAFSIMDEKDRGGKVTAKDVCGWALAGLSTAGVIFADQIIPQVGSKIKLGDMARKLFK